MTAVNDFQAPQRLFSTFVYKFVRSLKFKVFNVPLVAQTCYIVP